jgi:hypothetical protein
MLTKEQAEFLFDTIININDLKTLKDINYLVISSAGIIQNRQKFSALFASIGMSEDEIEHALNEASNEESSKEAQDIAREVFINTVSGTLTPELENSLRIRMEKSKELLKKDTETVRAEAPKFVKDLVDIVSNIKKDTPLS